MFQNAPRSEGNWQRFFDDKACAESPILHAALNRTEHKLPIYIRRLFSGPVPVLEPTIAWATYSAEIIRGIRTGILDDIHHAASLSSRERKARSHFGAVIARNFRRAESIEGAAFWDMGNQAYSFVLHSIVEVARLLGKLDGDQACLLLRLSTEQQGDMVECILGQAWYGREGASEDSWTELSWQLQEKTATSTMLRICGHYQILENAVEIDTVSALFDGTGDLLGSMLTMLTRNEDPDNAITRQRSMHGIIKHARRDSFRQDFYKEHGYYPSRNKGKDAGKGNDVGKGKSSLPASGGKGKSSPPSSGGKSKGKWK